MGIKIQKDRKRLTAFIQGEVDHHSAAFIRNEIDSALCQVRPSLLVLDFSEVTFMDSSGIGLVMGRYKLIKSIGGEIRVENLSPSAYKIMHLAGVERLGEIRQKETIQ